MLLSANNHVLAAGLKDYVTGPNFDNWKAFAPTITLFVGAVSSLAIIVGIVMLLVNVLAFAGSSRNAENHEKAVGGMKRAGIAILLGTILVAVFLKLYPIMQSFAK